MPPSLMGHFEFAALELLVNFKVQNMLTFEY